MHLSLRSVALVLLALFFSLGCGVSSLLEEPGTTAPAPPPANTPFAGAPPAPLVTIVPVVVPTPVPVSGLDSEETLLVNLYERVSPSVVFVTVQLSGSTPATSGEASGSGFVLDQDGHIVTNNHVVEGASKVQVKFSDNLNVQAKVVGRDPDTDLAVLLVTVPKQALRPVPLGDSEALRVGQRVVAIGNPFGFERAMSVGYISAVGRVVQLTDSLYSLPELIQTDAAINPGNSGGPLLNTKGEVVGVTNLIFSRSGVNSGVGFAVPVETVKRVVPDLIKTGSFAHPYLGISADRDPINSDMAQQLSLPVEHGVIVQVVTAGGPAEKAGLRGSTQRATYNGRAIQVGGDIIVAIDGRDVHSFDDIITYLAKFTKVGQTVELSIFRGTTPQKVKLTLGERPRQ
jgi:2-alkenal reductase